MIFEFHALDGMLYCEDNIYHCFACKDAISSTDVILETGNIYGIRGAIGSGNWALAGIILNPSTNNTHVDTILMNGKELSEDEYKKIVYNINDGQYFDKGLTAAQLICEGLEQSNFCLSQEDVINTFGLTVERFNRLIEHMGIEAYRLLIAHGAITGKKIFIMPFISESNIHILNYVYADLEYLADNDCVVIVPFDNSLHINYMFNKVIYMYHSKLYKQISITPIHQALSKKYKKLKALLYNKYTKFTAQ